jgi:hypothetical protein
MPPDRERKEGVRGRLLPPGSVSKTLSLPPLATIKREVRTLPTKDYPVLDKFFTGELALAELHGEYGLTQKILAKPILTQQ